MGTDAGFVDSFAHLKAGGEYKLYRYELPDDHPARRDGELHDYVTLGTDDLLRWPSCRREAQSSCGCCSVCAC